ANLGVLPTQNILGLEAKRLNMYLNFMKYGMDREIDDKPGKESSAELDMLAMGVHVRYDWIDGKGTKLLRWGGGKLHFGYEYDKTDLTFKTIISETVVQTGANGEQIQGTINGAPTASIAVNTHSTPIEISTDVLLLYVLSL